MNKEELQRIIIKELKEALNKPEERLLQTAGPISDKKNRRMFRKMKETAEKLYQKYTQTGSKPGPFGIERNLQKFKSPEELNQISTWFQEWSKVLKTANSYDDLWDTLKLLPSRLKKEFETKLGNINENMDRTELNQIIQEELNKALNESRDIEWSEYNGKMYPALIPNGTQITVDGEPGTITSNFMDRGDEFATYKVTLDSGNQIEISSADSSIKMLDEINEGKGKDLADETIKKLREKFKNLTDDELDEFRKIIKDFL